MRTQTPSQDIRGIHIYFAASKLVLPLKTRTIPLNQTKLSRNFLWLYIYMVMNQNQRVPKRYPVNSWMMLDDAGWLFPQSY